MAGKSPLTAAAAAAIEEIASRSDEAGVSQRRHAEKDSGK